MFVLPFKSAFVCFKVAVHLSFIWLFFVFLAFLRIDLAFFAHD